MEDVIVENVEKRQRSFTNLVDMPVPPGWARIFDYAPRFVLRFNQLHQNVAVDELLARTGPNPTHYNPDLPNPSSPELLTSTASQIALCLFWERGIYDVSITRAFEKAANHVNEAILACDLERYRCDVGSFPDSLESLTPRYLNSIPSDLYSGKPMIYRKVREDSYTLYSVGKKKMDDGGVIDSTLSEFEQSNDIWLYAPRPRAKTAPQNP